MWDGVRARMDLLLTLDMLGVVVAVVAFFFVVTAWRARSARTTFMAICWSLGLVSLLLSFQLGGALPVRADSLDFARGISLGLSIGLFLGVVTVFQLDAMTRARRNP